MRRWLELKWRLLPLLLVAVVLLIPVANNYLRHKQVAAAAKTAQRQLQTTPPMAKQISGEPSRIIIPRLAIDLPVVRQTYSTTTKTWPVAASSANYATETAPLNNTKGQTLIYGHNNRAVFGPLLSLAKGDEAYVYSTNGHIFKYSYTGAEDVTPTKLSVISDMAKAPAGLKLITCDGQYFQYRHLMSFKLVQAS